MGLLYAIFCTFVPELWPLIYAEILFPLNILKTNRHIFTKFIYAFILTRSSLGLLHVIFRTFVPESWPLIYSKIWFPLNILKINGQILTKLYITIFTDKICVGIVSCHFLHICTSVTALDLRQNFVSVQYLENKWTEFHQILYMHLY